MILDKQRDPDTKSRKKRLLSTSATPPTPQQGHDDPSSNHQHAAAAAPPPLAGRPDDVRPPPPTIHRRQDRGSGDDDGVTARRLPIYCRYRDLVDAGLCTSWQALFRLIDKHGFPPGILLSPNTRAWDVDEIRQWLASRPREKKPIPATMRRPRRTKEAEPVSANP